MSLESRLAALEKQRGSSQDRGGSSEWHSPDGIGSEFRRYVPCDLRADHGEGCFMSVMPTSTGVRFMRIVSGMEPE